MFRGISSFDGFSRVEQSPNANDGDASSGLATVFTLLAIATAILAVAVLLTSLISQEMPKANCPDPQLQSGLRLSPRGTPSVSDTPLFALPPCANVVQSTTGNEFVPLPCSGPFPMSSMQQFSPVPATSPPPPPPAPPPTPPPAGFRPQSTQSAQQPQEPFAQTLFAQPSFAPSAQPTAQWLMSDESSVTLLDGAAAPAAKAKPASNSALTPSAMLFPDPRVDVAPELPSEQAAFRKDVGVMGFCRAGSVEIWDSICGSGVLSNSWDLGPNGVSIGPFGSDLTSSFENAEAAYQALALWDRADSFHSLGASQAQQLARELAGSQDATFSGHGGSWRAMLMVLRAKFMPGSLCAKALRRTGDAFLLEHDGDQRLDRVYSGDGTNWLGLQLMLIRDELRDLEEDSQSFANSDSVMSWTEFAVERCAIDLRTGAQQPSGGDTWQNAVRSATSVLLLRLILQPSAPAGGSTEESCIEKKTEELDWGSA